MKEFYCLVLVPKLPRPRDSEVTFSVLIKFDSTRKSTDYEANFSSRPLD